MTPLIRVISVTMVVVLLFVALRLMDGRNTGSVAEAARSTASRTLAERAGTYFLPLPADPHAVPHVERIPIPDVPGGHAIWGATGRDDGGHVWFAQSSGDGEFPAQLFEYLPDTGAVIERGDPVTALRSAGMLRAGEHQMKIHSKIVQADDGYLYFSSMNDEGEEPDGSRLPRWGSHLWRLKPDRPQWEHVLAAPEALIAVATNGRWVYALGYWGHVVYQYDTRSAKVGRTEVGSVGGHISRNFVSDTRGHVYVPRLEPRSAEAGVPHNRRPLASEGLAATLVELNTDLQAIGETVLEHYLADDKGDRSHGIIATTALADGSFVFATHVGYLYQVTPPVNEGKAVVQPLGWFHPAGEAYTPSLFSFSGARYLVGLGRARQTRRFEWIVFDLTTSRSEALPFAFGEAPKALLYGSLTRDSSGGFYIGGRAAGADGKQHPVLLRATMPP